MNLYDTMGAENRKEARWLGFWWAATIIALIAAATFYSSRMAEATVKSPPCYEIQWLVAGKIAHVERTPPARLEGSRIVWGDVVYQLPTAGGWKLIEVACDEEAP